MTEQSGPSPATIGGVRLLRWRGAGLPGSPLVFLHGLGDTADIWQPVLRAWPTGPMAAIAPDLPGHGGSDWLSPADYSLKNITGHLAQTLTATGIRKPVIIGHSLGARVALSLAADGLIAPERLILVDVNPDPRGDVGAAVSAHIDALIKGAATIDAFVDTIGDRMPLADRDVLSQTLPDMVLAGRHSETDETVRMHHDPEIKRLLDAPSERDGWAQLAALTCPVSIIRGEFSSVLNAKALQKMAAATSAPTSTFTVPKAGHAIALEQPHALARRLTAAISGTMSSLG